ncbi:heme o synthase [Tropheryma whipplei]|uniref:Protoheme IX farnesyltransferase n=3 Tax=Tropheryma whipplei TaxID=2039 RepID=COXX_TROWT|nr:heme o synthase [Tropheryma whipplei]Q83GF8.1 RecName: Full=Protoheme IX farnesyltransferase; AltName: Full=Heme B farnesyltransferase; AltName: Full=Heme O synthase [Tropheryma whipplei str. Twist]Q83NK0.1 RecName: Full=Protoheme IX farnesyltransferase; AltName: Full=Heme B farnesyltransferase; AltName: Full=Heme O synthase [Tropheryma whipplei TW08/27]AAO44436.1 protoheme IX farnesyltransferase [Tropheryma whipplei str. Twist]MCO8182400.1 heme o synthase [Tropheryma whipplei]MCO8190170.1 
MGMQGRSFARQIRAYVSLTKPRVVELLLLTTVPTMILAQRGVPNPLSVLSVLLGGAMSAGAAGAFNCYIDRDIDSKMSRTRNRPLVTGALSPKASLIFAWMLCVISVLWFLLFVNWLSALLSAIAVFLYAFFYSIVLKKRTPQNIVWGGLAGCMPVLIAWAAVTGSIDWPAIVLFAVVFLWTPPHYWPLSIHYSEDYRLTSIPMLGAIFPRKLVVLQVLLYAFAVVACTLLLIPVAHMTPLYGLFSAVLGAWFVYEIYRLYVRVVRGHEIKAMHIFSLSNTYLSLVFLSVGIDGVVSQLL